MPSIKGYRNGVIIYDNLKQPIDGNRYSVGKSGAYAGIVYGIKYECVEFARRYYIQKFHVTFPQVENAYELFDLKYVIDLRSKKKIRVHVIPNSDRVLPEPGDMIIWKPEGQYHTTGHVAIMKEIVNRSIVTIAEQNGKTSSGHRNIRIHHPGILGWIHLDDNQRA
jgi:hypothetical protein